MDRLDLERSIIPTRHCREIIDNVVDMAHFFYVHYAFPTYFKNVFEGHVATQYLNSRAAPTWPGAERTARTTCCSSRRRRYYGPSYMIDPLRDDVQAASRSSRS